MKKQFSLFILFCSTFSTFCQVTTNPNSIGVGPTTNPLIPLHINKNGEVARFQGTSPYISFYEGSQYNGFIQAFFNSLGIGTKNSSDLNFYTDDIIRLNINASNGQVFAQERFNALSGINLTGPLRAAGSNNGQIGDVLMSLGNTTPAWSSVSQNPQIGFRGQLNISQGFPNYTEGFLSGFQQRFDDGGDNFNPTTGVYTVPSSGLYLLKATAVITKFVNSDPSINDGVGTIAFYVNGVKKDTKIFSFKTHLSYSFHYDAETYLKLNQSDTINVSFIQVNEHLLSVGVSGSNSGGYGQTDFTGIKIY